MGTANTELGHAHMTRERVLALRLGLRPVFRVWLFKKRVFLSSLKNIWESLRDPGLSKPEYLWSICISLDHVL